MNPLRTLYFAMIVIAPFSAVAGAFQPGLYRVTPIDPESKASEHPQNLCATSEDALIRLRHQGLSGCRDTFVQPGRDRTTVTYSCTTHGWGRTELRRETNGLFQLDTQGIYGRTPFALRAEARRIGDCGESVQASAKH